MSWFGDLLGGVGDTFSSGLSNIGSSIGDWFGGGGTSGALGLGSLGSDASSIDWGAAAQDATSGGLNFGAGLGSALSGLDLGSFSPSAVSSVIGSTGIGGSPTPASAVPTSAGISASQLGGAATLGAKALAGGGQQQPVQQQPQQQQTPATLPAQIASGLTGGGSGNSGGLGGLINGALGGNLGSIATLVGAVPGLASLFEKPSLGPQADQLQKQADQQQALVNNQLMPTALANQQGQINGEALSTINSSLQRQKAAMRDAYARMGMSGSTMEAQDLAGLDQQAAQQVFATGQQMATTGLQTAASLSNQDTGIYQTLMDQQLQLDKEYRDALAEFAAAAVAPSNNTTVNNNTGGGGQAAGPGVVGGNAASNGFQVGPSAGGIDPLTGLLTSIPTPATPIDTTGMTPSPSGGLVVPGLTDPNAGTSPYDNIDWGSFGGNGSFNTSTGLDYANIDWSQLGI